MFRSEMVAAGAHLPGPTDGVQSDSRPIPTQAKSSKSPSAAKTMRAPIAANAIKCRPEGRRRLVHIGNKGAVPKSVNWIVAVQKTRAISSKRRTSVCVMVVPPLP